MIRAVTAFYKGIVGVILNFLEVSCLLDSKCELDLFALELIILELRNNAVLEQFMERWNFQQTTHRSVYLHLNHQRAFISLISRINKYGL